MSAWTIGNKLVQQADILVILLDGRYPQETFPPDLFKKIKSTKKPYLFVLNKSDLVTQRFAEIKLSKEITPFIWFSSTKHYGVHELRRTLLAINKKRPLSVGILGYPNVGKSSFINCLSQRHAAPTSATAGFTKSMSKIRVAKDIYFFDTPGVPAKRVNHEQQGILGTIDPSHLRDPDLAALALLERLYPNQKSFKAFYGIEIKKDYLETLEELAVQMNYLKKGGIPDLMRASRKLLEDWQRGKLKV